GRCHESCIFMLSLSKHDDRLCNQSTRLHADYFTRSVLDRALRAWRCLATASTTAMPTASVAAIERKPPKSLSTTSIQAPEIGTSGLSALSVIDTTGVPRCAAVAASSGVIEL